MELSYTLKIKTNVGTLDLSKSVEGHEDGIDSYAQIEYNRAKKRAKRITEQGYYDEQVGDKVMRKSFYTYELIDGGIE